MKWWLLVFGLSVFSAQAEWSLHGTAELSPQYRRLNQSGFSDLNEIYDGYGLIDGHAAWTGEHWFFEAKPEVRALVSRGVGDLPPEEISVKTSRRALNTVRTITYREDGEAYFDFDRLNFRYTTGLFEAYAGRRPLTLGVLRFFPVWNKLTMPIVFEPGPEWIENPDTVGASVQLGSVSYRLFAVRGDEPQQDDLALIEMRYFGTGYELQALGGYWWEHTAGGLAGSFDLWGHTFRTENLWISRQSGERAQFQNGLGVEAALSAKWTLVTEAFYQSEGLTDLKYIKDPPNRFMTLSGRFYALPYLIYQVHPLWKLNGGFVVNLDNETSYIGLGGFEYSAGDNTTLTFKIKWPFGAPEGEFGPRRLEDLSGHTAGLTSSAILQLQTVF